MPQLFIWVLSISRAPLQASTSSSWASSGKPSRTRNKSSFQRPRRVAAAALRTKRHKPGDLAASLCGRRHSEATEHAHQMKRLALTGLPRILAEANADPLAVMRRDIEQ